MAGLSLSLNERQSSSQINQTLRALKIGSNPLGNSGCFALMKAIKTNSNSALGELHLDNITVKKNFLGRAFFLFLLRSGACNDFYSAKLLFEGANIA